VGGLVFLLPEGGRAALVALHRPGGMLIADNVASHANELQDYLCRVKSHPQLFAVTLPIGNGEEIAPKLDNGG
jgi:predicted O-methyltransferase YrrM